MDTQPTGVMAQLLADQAAKPLPKVGDLVTGRVLSVSKSEVHLDLDGLTTGVVRGRELFDESGETAGLKVSDQANATVLELENENGEMELSFRSAGHRKAWDHLLKLRDDGTVFDVPIVDANRGGLMVKVGRIEGFLPVSQLGTEHYPRVEGGDKQRILEVLKQFAGQTFHVKVLDVVERDEKLIVSEKAAREEAQRAALSQFQVGQVVKGRITGVVDFGAFVEFAPGLEGLCHISELAWQRVDNLKEKYRVGDELEAKIIALEGTKVSLSVKQMTEDPWRAAIEQYHVGQIVRGTVARLNTFGAFVELSPEIQGLCHISELSRRLLKHPREAVKEGESYTFSILAIDPNEHRLSLSKKALEETPDRDRGTRNGERGSAAPQTPETAVANEHRKPEAANQRSATDATPDAPSTP